MYHRGIRAALTLITFSLSAAAALAVGGQEVGQAVTRTALAAPPAPDALSSRGPEAAPAAPAAEAAPPPAPVDSIDLVYDARGGAPIWLTADFGAAEALIEALRAAPSHAMPAARYDAGRLAAKVAAARADAARLPEADRALSAAFVAWARDLAGGALEARSMPGVELEVVRPARSLLLAAAARAVESGDIAAHLADLAPRHPDYERLRAYYAEQAALAASEAAAPRIPDGPTLRAGERGPRVAALRARLTATGDLAGPAAADPERFDDALSAAVKRFQARKGLGADGAVGRMTLAALNASAADRAASAAVNLERMRWMNRPLGTRHIMVNIPDFTVSLVDGDDVLFRERVVVGKLATQTPEFSDEMSHIVLNPTWFVPRSIATEDILPKLQADPTYLSQRNMRLVRGDGGEIPSDPSLHDWSAYSRGNFPYAIRQRPDAGNALGKVKFIFPNNHAIYLHDTPQKNLFDRVSRAYSWGCVRVRDPLRLAEALLAPQEAEPRAFIDRVLATGRERYVHLDVEVPVHLVYRTLWVDADGAVHTRPDVYGRDAAVLRALRAAGVDAPLS
jgi:murein L,D-transpeptidase YcbB/YkuD